MKALTIREMALFLNVSKTAVQNFIRRESIQYDFVKKNKQYYSAVKARGIILAINPTVNADELEKALADAPSTLKSQASAEEVNSALSAALSDLRQQLSVKDQQIANLHEQLIAKDQQLSVKDQQISAMNDRLADAFNVTRGLQYITAADKAKQLMDTNSSTADAPAQTAEKADVVEAEGKQPQSNAQTEEYQAEWSYTANGADDPSASTEAHTENSPVKVENQTASHSNDSFVSVTEVKADAESAPKKKGFWKKLFSR